MGRNDAVWITIEGTVKKKTEAAVGFETELADAGSLLWIPKSQIKGVNGRLIDEDEADDMLNVDDEVESIALPEWLANEKGLEPD